MHGHAGACLMAEHTVVAKASILLVNVAQLRGPLSQEAALRELGIHVGWLPMLQRAPTAGMHVRWV